MFAQGISRRTFVMLSASALAMGLFGCGKDKETQVVEDSSETAAEELAETLVTGGWEVNEDVPAVALSDDERAVFDRALEGYVGMNFQPVCVLATQVVAGTNRAFLCQGSPVVPDAKPGWYVVVVYEDLEGACSIISAEEIDVSEPATAEETVPEGLMGGWSVVNHTTDDTVIIPDEAAAAFVTGGETYVGVNLRPIALLGTQLVAGTNYRLLCSGALGVPDAVAQLYVVDVYQDLEGAAKYSDVLTLDLLAYV